MSNPKNPPEPSTTAEELAEAQATAYAEPNQSKDCPRCGDLFYHPKTLIEDQRQRAKEWEDVAKAKDAEIAALKALLHDEAKDYAETIMKLCEECGVESIQDIGPKLAELKAEHDRLQEDLCEKVVSEGGALEAELTQLRQSLAESERKAAGLYLDRLVERSVSLNDAKRNPEILDAMIESADRAIREHYKKSREALAAADEKEKP